MRFMASWLWSTVRYISPSPLQDTHSRNGRPVDGRIGPVPPVPLHFLHGKISRRIAGIRRVELVVAIPARDRLIGIALGKDDRIVRRDVPLRAAIPPLVHEGGRSEHLDGRDESATMAVGEADKVQDRLG